MSRPAEEGTDEELARAAHHTCYELHQMVEAAVSRSKSGDVAFLESALLHARNLIEIFCEWPSARIVAGDFLPGWTPVSSNRFSRESRVLNNWLSHLTWRRVDWEERVPWDPIPLVVRLVDLYDAEFVEHLSPDRQDWFSGTVAVVRSKLTELSDDPQSHFDATTSDTLTTMRTFKPREQ